MRATFFVFGLVLGSCLLIFFLNKKGTKFNYLPNERVLSLIRKKEIRYAPNIEKTDTSLCLKILFHGEVVFSESLIGGGRKCNEYKISLPEKTNLFIRVDLCDSTSLIKEISKE